MHFAYPIIFGQDIVRHEAIYNVLDCFTQKKFAMT